MKWLDTFTQVQAGEDNCRDVDDDDSNIHATQTQDDGDKPIEDKKEQVRSIVQKNDHPETQSRFTRTLQVPHLYFF